MKGKKIMDINNDRVEHYENIYVWKTRVMPYYINDNYDISEHVFIYVENKITKDCELSVYNEFLRYTYYDKSEDLISCESVRKPCTHLCMFLNYLFTQKHKPIRSLKEMTYDDVNAFLNEYSNGNVGQNTGTYKDYRTVKEVKHTIDAFGYWLSRMNKRDNKVAPNFKMKDFKKEEYTNVRGKRGTRYETPFSVRIHGRIKRMKVKEVNATLLLSLLYTANYYDKMITLAIALQGFAGLREGEAMQMCKERITIDKPRDELYEFTIDLWNEKIIRNDGIITGHIKIPRDQCVYYSFLPIIDLLYTEHLQLLRELGCDNDKYGALFFNKRGCAMQVDNYEERFQKILAKTINLLSVLFKYGNKEAGHALTVLHRATMTSHSLRYYFTGFITDKCKGNIFEIAAWRGDKSIQSALTYLRKYRPLREIIKEAQNDFVKDYQTYATLVKEARNEG